MSKKVVKEKEQGTVDMGMDENDSHVWVKLEDTKSYCEEIVRVSRERLRKINMLKSNLDTIINFNKRHYSSNLTVSDFENLRKILD